MLGDMIRSWKYPTRLVMVIRVPIGAFFLRLFATSTVPASAATSSRLLGWRSKCRSSFGVLTRSCSDLSASRLISNARTVFASSSSLSDADDSSEGVSASVDPACPAHPATLADMTRGSELAHPETGLVPRGVFDPPIAFDFSWVGDMARPGSLDEIASPQLRCRLRSCLLRGLCLTSSTTERGDLWDMWSFPCLIPGMWFSECSVRSTRKFAGDIQEVKLKSRAG